MEAFGGSAVRRFLASRSTYSDSNQLRLWRKTKDEHGQSALIEVLDPATIGNRPLFVFPGNRVDHENKRGIGSAAKQAERFLGGEFPTSEVDVITISYPSQAYIEAFSRRANKEPAFVDNIFSDFTKKWFMPLIERDVPVTAMGHSAGTTAITGVQSAATKIAVEDPKMSLQDICSRFATVVTVVYGNISESYSLQQQEARPEFTAIVVNNRRDLVSRDENPRSAELIPAFGEGPERGQISIHRLGNNSLLVTTEIKPGFYWPEPSKWDDQGIIAELDSMMGHSADFYTRINTGALPGSVETLMHTVRNAVTRNPGTVDPLKLVGQVAREVPERLHQFSETQQPSIAVRAIAVAVRDAELRSIPPRDDSTAIRAAAEAAEMRYPSVSTAHAEEDPKPPPGGRGQGKAMG